MGDDNPVVPSASPTARTAPARPGDATPAAVPTHAGLVLLYAPEYRSLPPALPFDRPEITLGRDESCTLALADVAVSRRHVRIVAQGGGWRLFDLESRNGTFVDGERVHEADLEPLHEVRVGDALFKFVDTNAEEFARYRIDGAIDGAMPPSSSPLLGGFTIRRSESELVRIAPTELSCVVLGETGTGKEVFAREVHRLSGRPGAFQAIHCGAIPKELLESELFGYKRGAFSGAHRDKPGLIQQAHQGTLFLDEIGDMPLEAQVKLLRVLQSHELVPLGATTPEPVDLRVVCATHRDLYRYVRDGKFRGDLFARVNEYVAVLPPLRDRKEDIFGLTTAFLARYGTRRLEPSLGFMMALLQYDWPFNVRELESAIKRAAALAEGVVLDARHLPPPVLEAAGGVRATSIEPSALRSPSVPAPDELSAPARPHPPADRDGQAEPEGFLRGTPTEAKMRELLARFGGNVAAVARELGKGRMQIHRWMRRYGLTAEEYRPR